MKKFLIFAAAAAVLLTVNSCQKKGIDAPVVGNGPEESVEVSFSLTGMEAEVSTKAADASSVRESVIKDVQIFVFRTDDAQNGRIDNAVHVSLAEAKTGSYEMAKLKCTVGKREAWAIVNAPKDYTSDANINTLADLKKQTVLLADNADSDGQKLIMVGNVMKDKDGKVVNEFKSGEQKVSISVSRLVAAVRLAKVINKIQTPSLQGSVEITGAYLMNVPGKQQLDGTLSAKNASQTLDADWYAQNKKFNGTGNVVKLLVEKPSSGTTISYGDDGFAPKYLFYSMPSDFGGKLGTTDALVREEATKTNFRSSTYLVVEMTVGGMKCVYPVLLPQLEANRKYNVNLTVNHIGGDPEKPWERIKFTDFTPTVTVTDWVSETVDETI